MKLPKVEERIATALDGTRIAYHGAGSGPPILLANGLGGSWRAWSHQLAYFQDRYRFLSWDYRGLYRSSAPADRDALTIGEQARDALAVLDAEGIEQVAILAWSMGVQVALELFRIAPHRVRLMVMINGVAGSPWDTLFNLKFMGSILPYALRAARSVPELTLSLTERVMQSPETITWAKRVGLAGHTLDEEVFAVLANSFVGLDMELYIRTLELLGEHDAHDVLPQVDVPTLVVAGDRDLFTPRRAAERIVHAIAGSELMIIPGGTHYVAVEYPEMVNLRIEKFFRERGYWNEDL